MGSKRTTVLFFVIVGIAVIIVAAGLLFQVLSDLGSEPTPTSLTWICKTLANRTNALSLSGTEKDILEIYLAISSYF